jgi:hypothetical protein
MSSPEVRRHEQATLPRVVSALQRWLGAVAGAVLSPTVRFLGLPDAVAVYSQMQLWESEIAGLRPELETAARIGWSEAFGQPTFSSTSSHVLEALNGSHDFLMQLPNEVNGMVIREISDGLSAGMSRQEIVDSVERLLMMTGNNTFRNRAQVITGTEITRAANAGALAAAIDAQSTLGPILKRWNDTGDDQVRQSHDLADDTEIPVMQPFVVGGFPLMYPGDPTGPPWEVIACRCGLSFRRVNG